MSNTIRPNRTQGRRVGLNDDATKVDVKKGKQPSIKEQDKVETAAEPHRRARGEKAKGSRKAFAARNAASSPQVHTEVADGAKTARNKSGTGAKGKPKKGIFAPVKNADSAFVKAVQKNFHKWDLDGNRKLDTHEVDTAMTRRAFRGRGAAALATIDTLSNADDFTDFRKKDLVQTERGFDQNGATWHDDRMKEHRETIRAYKNETTLFDVDGVPDIDDMSQGYHGDCYFLAALGAKVERDPESVKKMVKEVGPNLYDVQFGEDTVRIKGPSHAQVAKGASSNGEGRWLEIAEKAYAVYKNRGERSPNTNPYDTIGDGGWMSHTFRDMGHQTETYGEWNKPPSLQRTQELLEQGKAENKMMTAAIADNSPAGLPTKHAYTITDYDPVSRIVSLRNPWGALGSGNRTVKDLGDGNFQMSLKDFRKNFSVLEFAT